MMEGSRLWAEPSFGTPPKMAAAGFDKMCVYFTVIGFRAEDRSWRHVLLFGWSVVQDHSETESLSLVDIKVII
jgi:hypothetical protein